jgi:hypothetical protein
MSASASSKWRTAFVVAVVVIGAMLTGVISLPFGASSADARGGLPPYTARANGSALPNSGNSAVVTCDPGDQATGGGYEGVDFATTNIIDNGPGGTIDSPDSDDAWVILYTNGAQADSVTSIIICRDKRPAHVP